MTKNLSVQELLDAAKQEGDVKYTENQENTDILKFIEYYGLKPGNDRYSYTFMELLYRDWSKKQQPSRCFHNMLRGHIGYSRNNTFYSIDNTALKFNEEELKQKVVHAAFKYRVVNEEEEKEDQRQIRRIKSKKTTQASQGLHRL